MFLCMTLLRESRGPGLFPTEDNCPLARGVASDRETKSQSVRADAVVRAGAVRADGVEGRCCTSTSDYHHHESCRLEPTMLGAFSSPNTIIVAPRAGVSRICSEGRSKEQLALHRQPVSCMQTDSGFSERTVIEKLCTRSIRGACLQAKKHAINAESGCCWFNACGDDFSTIIHLLREPREHELLHCFDAINRNLASLAIVLPYWPFTIACAGQNSETGANRRLVSFDLIVTSNILLPRKLRFLPTAPTSLDSGQESRDSTML
jgi:hypothetical protein